MEFRNLNTWYELLHDLCKGSDYDVQFNGAKGPSSKGVVIVPKNQNTPQRIAIYPKKTKNPGIAIEMDVYQNYRGRVDLPEPDKVKSNRPHFNDLPEDTVIALCKAFLQK